jgi:nitrite reductase (cytochrome c-552)
LRTILAKYNAADYSAPDFSSKEKAQAIIGLNYKKEVDEKNTFLDALNQEWFKQGEAKGLYDPASRKDMVRKTSYNTGK